MMMLIKIKTKMMKMIHHKDLQQKPMSHKKKEELTGKDSLSF